MEYLQIHMSIPMMCVLEINKHKHIIENEESGIKSKVILYGYKGLLLEIIT